MYIKDGICYAGNPVSGMKVTFAKVVNDHSMLVGFSTGETRLFDAQRLLDVPVFSALASEAVFEDFSIDHGVLTWLDGEIDIAPEKLYSLSYAYEGVA